MTAHIINIGDELLIGQVVNTNASWMAEELNKINVRVTRVSVIGDTGEAITSELERSMPEADIVLITGGLGPTKDDITKQVLARHFGAKMVTHQETLDRVIGYFKKRGIEMAEVNRGQALVPDCCEVIVNEVGTAPCMVIKREKGFKTEHAPSLQGGACGNSCVVVSMPGVPFEMKWLMTNRILPMIAGMGDNSAILHKTIGVFGIAESTLAERISDWEDALPENIRLAYLPKAGVVRLRLSAFGKSGETEQDSGETTHASSLQEIVDERVEQLKVLIGDNIFTENDESLSEAVGRMLRRNRERVSTAESCTAGLVSHRIVETAGSSAWFVGGVVAYSNEVKQSELQVPKEMLEKYGAVSPEVARSMAEGALRLTGSDWAIATTGISGPDGGSDEKPVGLVYIAVVGANGKSRVGKYVFLTTRAQHQERTANQALFDLYQIIKE